MLGVIPTVDTEIDPAGFPALDLTETLLRFTQLQTQLEASMATVGKLLNLSLMDYI